VSWSVRHAGSPRWVDGLTTDAIREAIGAGQWEPTDEVRPDGGGEWQPLESHPTFAGAAAEVEPRVAEPEDESRLDMNPLIDVSLVLLIFFILTTTYESIRKVLDLPAGSQASAAVRPSPGILSSVIRVDVNSRDGQRAVRVEGEAVAFDDLAATLSRLVKTTAKRQVLLDARGVEWGVVVEVMDVARGAGVEKTLLVTRQ
jgi:biopolymer transport protein ExbD